MAHLTDLEIAALVDQGVPSLQQSRVAQHVQHCAYCAGRVEETRVLMNDLAEPAASLWEALAEAVFRFRFPIPIRIAPRQARGDDSRFPPALRFEQQLSGLLGGPAREVETASLEFFSQDEQYRFKLSWQPGEQTVTNVDLQVVDARQQPSRAAAAVQLREQDTGRMLEWRRTDSNGRVIFKDLESGEYLVQVTYRGSTSEIPFSLDD